MADAAPAASSSVVFKGRMLTLTVLEVYSDDLDQIRADVAQQAARAPDFFIRLPVLLSIEGARPDLAELASELRRMDLFVAGVVDADDDTAHAAVAAGLGVTRTTATAGGAGQMSKTTSDQSARSAQGNPEAASTTDRPARERGAARVVSQPVRSGQQIYARGGDLVVLSSVSAGAEIIADGHIHVYGALRGRALAGAAGDESARVFCRRFEPDLIAIAGCYKVADAIEPSVHGRAVSVRLIDDNLQIDNQE
ncbi:septum site-determining protein MinC [Salinisphaera sp. USBA-960]|uniref:septum site-determining protein MinC n=1 Tax=Salinisphaera orenii TaxID=856731 RepID=UPI000DBE6B95|nr:septum site-determining protein MinC [Salifodinibacter halophilus]NNC26480.1 septum site-determining protein MinC [Salifodinibacter halophilus]